MLYVCVQDLMDVVYSVCFVMRGAVGARVCEVHYLYVAMSVSFCLPHPVAVSTFIICSGLCACTEIL